MPPRTTFSATPSTQPPGPSCSAGRPRPWCARTASLAKAGYGLLIHDAYRPWRVTKIFWDAVPESGRIFVADPSKGSKHNRGSAVDLTLYDRSTGKAVKMVGGYDEFSRARFLVTPAAPRSSAGIASCSPRHGGRGVHCF